MLTRPQLDRHQIRVLLALIEGRTLTPYEKQKLPGAKAALETHLDELGAESQTVPEPPAEPPPKSRSKR
jgi:hypothetical protein